MLPSQNPTLQLLDAIKSNNIDQAKAAIDQGAIMSGYSTEYGLPATYNSLYLNRREIVEYMISKGCDFSTDSLAMLALHLANRHIVKLVLDKSPKLNSNELVTSIKKHHLNIDTKTNLLSLRQSLNLIRNASDLDRTQLCTIIKGFDANAYCRISIMENTLNVDLTPLIYEFYHNSYIRYKNEVTPLYTNVDKRVEDPEELEKGVIMTREAKKVITETTLCADTLPNELIALIGEMVANIETNNNIDKQYEEERRSTNYLVVDYIDCSQRRMLSEFHNAVLLPYRTYIKSIYAITGVALEDMDYYKLLQLNQKEDKQQNGMSL